MAGRLEGEVALVTGAGRGIGRVTALALAREVADVVVSARTQPELDTLAQEIESSGRRVLVVVADVTQEVAVSRLRDDTLTTFGRLDILVNNVGVGKWGPIHSPKVQEYDWMMNSNVRSSFLCTHAFLPTMLERKHGCIVFVSSVSGVKATPHQAVYSATKFAQVGFAQGLDHEVREQGIRVSVIAPVGTRTDFSLGTGRTLDSPKREKYLVPEEVAEAVIFAVTQPPNVRVFLVGMRPMFEAF